MHKKQINFLIIGLFIFTISLKAQENQTGTIFIHTKPENVSVQISKLDYKIKNKPAGRLVISNVPQDNYKFKFSAQGLELSRNFFLNAKDTLTVLADFYRMEVSGATADELRKLVAADKKQRSIQAIYNNYIQKADDEMIDGFWEPSNSLMDTLINFLYPEDEVYWNTEDSPLFNRADPTIEFRKYIAYNLRYPDLAAENGIMGRVVIMFAVNSEGKVVDPYILNSVDPLLDLEAIRVVSSSPPWTPGRQNGKPVKVLFVFPMNFVLE